MYTNTPIYIYISMYIASYPKETKKRKAYETFICFLGFSLVLFTICSP